MRKIFKFIFEYYDKEDEDFQLTQFLENDCGGTSVIYDWKKFEHAQSFVKDTPSPLNVYEVDDKDDSYWLVAIKDEDFKAFEFLFRKLLGFDLIEPDFSE